jgi:hypothetical protein
MKNPIDLKHDRRHWIKASAAALGASVLPISSIGGQQAPTELQRPQVGPKPPHTETAGAKSGAKLFTPAQHALVEELSETIIPADANSGGAKAAKVADFIEQTVGESVEEERKELWREGLRLIESMSQHYNGKSFADSSSEERYAMLKVLSDHADLTELPEVKFFNELKELTVHGYYTSKIGIHDELQYQGNRILMEYVGCGDPTPPRS